VREFAFMAYRFTSDGKWVNRESSPARSQTHNSREKKSYARSLFEPVKIKLRSDFARFSTCIKSLWR
jgi:hypothetical protein